jgi:hypothetical protein
LGGQERSRVAKARVIVFRREGEIAFLNVDVVVVSMAPLEPLVSALGEKVSILHLRRDGRNHHARFALYSPGSPDAAIRRLVKVIDALPKPARRLWAAAKDRVFDIGLQGGVRPHCREFQLTGSTVAALKRVGGSILITVYPAEVARRRQKSARTSRPTSA